LLASPPFFIDGLIELVRGIHIRRTAH
jgi:hypothetical protein